MVTQAHKPGRTLYDSIFGYYQQEVQYESNSIVVYHVSEYYLGLLNRSWEIYRHKDLAKSNHSEKLVLILRDHST